MTEPTPPLRRPSPEDPFGEGQAAARARRGRNLAIGVALLVFVTLVFINTIYRLSANVREYARLHPAVAHAPPHHLPQAP